MVNIVEKYNRYISESILTSTNLSGTLFVVSFSVNMLFVSFSRVLSWKCINHTDIVALSTLNTQRTAFYFVYNRSKRNIYLVFCFPFYNCVLCTVFWQFNLKMHQLFLSSFSLFFKYTKHTLFLWLKPLNAKILPCLFFACLEKFSFHRFLTF